MQRILRQPTTWLVIAIVVVIAIVANTTRDNEPRTVLPTTPAGGAQEPGCIYAFKLEDTIAAFIGSASRATGTAGASDGDINRAFETFDRETDALIRDLQAVSIPAEIAPLNSGFITLFQEMRAEIAPLRTAALARDQAALNAEQGRFNELLVRKAADVQNANEEVSRRLSLCTR